MSGFRPVVFVVLLLLSVVLADPVPPTTFGNMWYSWVKTSIIKIGDPLPYYDFGQLVMYDSQSGITCRHLEQDLVHPTGNYSVDTCDYNRGLHYTVANATNNARCLNVAQLTDTMSAIVYPQEYLTAAKFMGTNQVNQKICNHFFAMIVLDGKQVQMDVWTSTDYGYPCEISIRDVETNVQTTWAFDGFDRNIPYIGSQQCTSAYLVCNPGIKCRAKLTDTDSQMAGDISWTCDPSAGKVDCSPINPGGSHYFPNTVRDHCNWAMDTYFQYWKGTQGGYACYYSGRGELYNSNNNQINTRTQPRTSQLFSTFLLDVVCPRY